MKNHIINYVSLIISILGFTLFLEEYFSENTTIEAYNYIGVLFMIPSLIMFSLARTQLGNAFQVSAQANKLVTKGIYKKISNPIYLFGLIFILGLIIFLQEFYMLLMWLVLIIIQLKRAEREKKVLIEKFGNEYLEYKSKTWF